jgi:hypothetical protein
VRIEHRIGRDLTYDVDDGYREIAAPNSPRRGWLPECNPARLSTHDFHEGAGTMSHTGSFDVRTATDFLDQMVVPQYNDLQDNNASSRFALLCAVVAYHMYEWANNGKKFSEPDFKSRYPAKAHLAGSFELARRLVNGTKHFQNRIGTRTQRGFPSAFSNAFARPLYVIRDDGTEISADDLIREIVEFWKAEKAAGAF